MTILNSNKKKKRQFPGSKSRKIYLNGTKFHKKDVAARSPRSTPKALNLENLIANRRK